jgi:hypothetical protein
LGQRSSFLLLKVKRVEYVEKRFKLREEQTKSERMEREKKEL